MQINRYIKLINVESRVVSPLQLYIHAWPKFSVDLNANKKPKLKQKLNSNWMKISIQN